MLRHGADHQTVAGDRMTVALQEDIEVTGVDYEVDPPPFLDPETGEIPSHHHILMGVFDLDYRDKDGKIYPVQVAECSCGDYIAGGKEGHHHHQFQQIDPHMVKEAIYQTSIMLYRTIPMNDGRPYHGFVKRARDRRKAWRKRAYREHLTK